MLPDKIRSQLLLKPSDFLLEASQPLASAGDQADHKKSCGNLCVKESTQLLPPSAFQHVPSGDTSQVDVALSDRAEHSWSREPCRLDTNSLLAILLVRPELRVYWAVNSRWFPSIFYSCGVYSIAMVADKKCLRINKFFISN